MIAFPFVCITCAAFYSLWWAKKRNALTFAIQKRLAMSCVLALMATWYFLSGGTIPPARGDWLVVATLAGSALLLWTIFGVVEWARDSQWFNDIFRQGTGASLTWAGEAIFRENRMPSLWWSRAGQIFYGRSRRMYDCRPRNVGVISDVHQLTFGLTGAGKSVYVLYNNISQFNGSCLVLDPKGELARETLQYRRRRGADCYILDPFCVDELKGLYDDHRVYYNPMDEVDMDDPDAVSIISGIARGCNVPGQGGEALWFSETEITPFEGLIGHFKSAKPYEQQNLSAIADAIGDMDSFIELLKEMADNDALGGRVRSAATSLLAAGEKQWGYVHTGLIISLKWTTHPRMRKFMSHSDISLRELLKGKTSIYNVLPLDEMDVKTHGRFMRVMMNLAISQVLKSPKKTDGKILMVFDEFPMLGKFERVMTSFNILRSYNVKLWVLAQGVGDLRALYQDDWQKFANNSNTQIIGINCMDTCKWVSRMLGEFRRRDEKGDWRSVPLMSPAEVSRFLPKEGNNQLVLPASGPAWQLKSVNWFKSWRSYRRRFLANTLERLLRR